MYNLGLLYIDLYQAIHSTSVISIIDCPKFWQIQTDIIAVLNDYSSSLLDLTFIQVQYSHCRCILP